MGGGGGMGRVEKLQPSKPAFHMQSAQLAGGEGGLLLSYLLTSSLCSCFLQSDSLGQLQSDQYD